MKKLIRDDNSIKINRNIQLFKNKIEKCYGLLCQKYKRIPTTLELAKYLNIDELLVIDVLNSTNCVSSLDNDTDFSLYELLILMRKPKLKEVNCLFQDDSTTIFPRWQFQLEYPWLV